jgi:hypothetical protein
LHIDIIDQTSFGLLDYILAILTDEHSVQTILIEAKIGHINQELLLKLGNCGRKL